MNPLQRLHEDRARARALADPYADLCALATVDSRNHPQVRTLVLRDLENKLAVFVNATSPKWPGMGRVAALVFLASLSVQYRLNCATEPVSAELMGDNWQLRPEMPKKLDWLYRAARPKLGSGKPGAATCGIGGEESSESSRRPKVRTGSLPDTRRTGAFGFEREGRRARPTALALD